MRIRTKMALDLPLDINSIKGFIDQTEGEALHRYALNIAHLGPCLEIGSYCGKSTVYLASACKAKGEVLYAVDHHRGSEEHQPGEEYHDPDLFNPKTQVFDSFQEFRRTVFSAGLAESVVPIVSTSLVASKSWTTALSMVFIDGGHSHEAALTDYRSWAGHIVRGGILAIHDIFPDPTRGGQAPFEIWKKALASGLFEDIEIVGTLGFLRRL
jgi:predicted O-methyltransferase YrrM